MAGQKSLTSFFGAAKSKKTGEVIQPKKIQSSIKSGLKKQASNSKQATKKEKNVENDEKKMPAAAKEESKPDAPSGKDADDLMDTDDEEETAPSNKITKQAKSAAGGGGRKRVIDEDSDSEDEDEAEAEKEEVEMNESGEDDEDYNDNDEPEEEEEEGESEEELLDSDSDNEDEDEDHVEEVKKPAAKKQSSKKSSNNDNDSPPPKAKKQKTLTGKKKPAVTSTKSKSGAAALAMKSNAQIRQIMSTEVLTDDTKTTNKPKQQSSSSNNKEVKTWEFEATTSMNSNTKVKTTPYSALCDVFSEIDEISGRLDIQEKLTMFFRKVLLRDDGGGESESESSGSTDKDVDMKEQGSADDKQAASAAASKSSDLYTLLYLTSNTVAPLHENVELGIGESILIKAIGEAAGSTPAMIKQKYAKDGDLGNVAMAAKGKQKTLVGFGRVSGPKRLSCVDVLKAFKEIANVSGSNSQKWKVDKIKSLLVRAKGSEAKYIIRGLQGKLRIGLSKATVETCIAHAVVLTRPKGVEELSEGRLEEIRGSDDNTEGAYPDLARKLCEKRLPLDVQLETAVAIIKKAYSQVPSYDSLLDAILNVPLQEVHKACELTPGIPVQPMLAKPTKSVQEVLKRLTGLRFTCEYKYDGERAQVHMTPGGKTGVFSRSLLTTSEKFPEVPLYVKESCKDTNVTSFVLDTEVVAFNRETGQFVPFQILSTRKRTEESAEEAKVKVIVQAFDLMYLNGESLLDKTLFERRELMKKNFLPVDGKFQYATSLDYTENGDTTVIEEFLDAAVKGQCEGLMVKTLDVNAGYEPSRRSLNWLKLKKDYLEGLGDSVDLVPLGAYYGKGKRTGVFGAYLLACYDEDTEEFQSVCKIGTGFSDEDLKELAASFEDHTISEKSSQYNVSSTLECDVWFDAVQVWEVKAADLSKSSTHKGAIDKTGESGRGIGLRFPRFERVRPDKNPEDATSSDQILDMFNAQDSIVEGYGYDDMDGI